MATVKEEHRYGKGSSETFSDLEKAISKMGKIINNDPGSLSIEGRIKYGLGASTKVKAKVQPEGDESIIVFESTGGDFAGRAARDNVKHLLETMTRINDANFDVNKADKQQWTRVGYFTLGGIGVLIFSIMVIVNVNWVADNWWVTAVLVAAYSWGLTKLGK